MFALPQISIPQVILIITTINVEEQRSFLIEN